MRISSSLEYIAPAPTVIALGFFDGVHRGHQAVIQSARSQADLLGCDCAVWTFSEPPRNFLFPGSVATITDPVSKQNALAHLGVDIMLCPPFDDKIRTMPAEEFFFQILKDRLSALHLVCGYNYSFGAEGQGDVALLSTLCERAHIGLTVLPDVKVNGVSVSSSAIRHAIQEGRMSDASTLLGNPFSLCAPVIDGQKLARRLGFPTMNQRFPGGMVIPKRGVYVTRVTLSSHPEPLFGISNVGIRPTVGGEEVFAETHLFDFNGNLYGQEATVEFLSFLRPEERFDSVEKLSERVHTDIEQAKRMIIAIIERQ
ncbi:MAG: bifunctional riboflavin kinase/FAD synthetase [Clostridia bacterium]|nr:bifunctional riboflavin kinase/FAD synthetase [Clostridia bacterium]